MADEMWQQEVRNLLLQRQKIEAIKLVRHQTGAGLKDAKDFVDAIERGQNPPAPPPAAPPQASMGCTVALAVIVLAIVGLVLIYFSRR